MSFSKNLNKYLAVCIFGTLLLFQKSALADCGWTAPGLKYYVDKDRSMAINFGTVYVPRDLAEGKAIGPEIKASFEGAYDLFCSSRGSMRVYGETPLLPGSEYIYQTNIPGVAIKYRMNDIYTASDFTRTDQYPNLPLRVRSGFWDTRESTTPSITATLVKAGPIAVGSHTIASTTITAFGDQGNTAWRMGTGTVSGTIIRSECTLPTASKTITVLMGAARRIDFSGKNSVLDARDIQIPLTDCMGDSSVKNRQLTKIHLRLDGVKGSTSLDATRGILGLTTDSVASGLGVQVLTSDNTAFPLNVAKEVITLVPGATTIKLKARYIQTSSDPQGPQPGTANAAANFTLTYQ
ncbi:type 1 fimbrial protein [Pseudomonas fragi]|uniref:fimbrial protein n=2 Tax=Pseudomonas TaxID=286 RepID=UPI0021BF473B|nr:fimbrial protein [Pseudomonas fragi]UXL36997.1 type 1 fimbrial protein [Pseudomonas fragi]